ncbi:hypothetical protein NAB1_1391 [Lactiplantibacillus plantarum]|nr:hypothetical protein NAB1_1391 [Lactiplantibacillus plantarum]
MMNRIKNIDLTGINSHYFFKNGANQLLRRIVIFVNKLY